MRVLISIPGSANHAQALQIAPTWQWFIKYVYKFYTEYLRFIANYDIIINNSIKYRTASQDDTLL